MVYTRIRNEEILENPLHSVILPRYMRGVGPGPGGVIYVQKYRLSDGKFYTVPDFFLVSLDRLINR